MDGSVVKVTFSSSGADLGSLIQSHSADIASAVLDATNVTAVVSVNSQPSPSPVAKKSNALAIGLGVGLGGGAFIAGAGALIGLAVNNPGVFTGTRYPRVGARRARMTI